MYNIPIESGIGIDRAFKNQYLIVMTITPSLSGLEAASFRLGVSSHDIANATTDGFSQRDVLLSESSIAGVQIQGTRSTNSPTDLAKEFGGELTYAQTGYSANLRVIETQDSMLGSLMDIRG